MDNNIYAHYPESCLSVACCVDLTPQAFSQSGLKALQNVSKQADKTAALIYKNITTPSYRDHLFECLAQAIFNALHHLDMVLPDCSREDSDTVTERYFATQKGTTQKIVEYKVYDGFFRQYRFSQQNVLSFLKSCLELWYNICLDLRYLSFPSDETHHLLCALSDTVKMGCHQIYARPEKETIAEIAIPSPKAKAYEAFWHKRSCIEDQNTQIHIAFYRWFTGHQLWNLSLNLLTALIKNASESENCSHLKQISCITRGSISMLWYTMQFPSPLYQQHISKAMEAYSIKHGSRGLSGSIGQDYTHYARALSQLCKAERPEYEEHIAYLHHLDLLFHEHHLILANEKVGLNYYSILQRVSGSSKPRRVSPAIVGMRERYRAKRFLKKF